MRSCTLLVHAAEYLLAQLLPVELCSSQAQHLPYSRLHLCHFEARIQLQSALQVLYIPQVDLHTRRQQLSLLQPTLYPNL